MQTPECRSVSRAEGKTLFGELGSGAVSSDAERSSIPVWVGPSFHRLHDESMPMLRGPLMLSKNVTLNRRVSRCPMEDPCGALIGIRGNHRMTHLHTGHGRKNEKTAACRTGQRECCRRCRRLQSDLASAESKLGSDNKVRARTKPQDVEWRLSGVEGGTKV